MRTTVVLLLALGAASCAPTQPPVNGDPIFAPPVPVPAPLSVVTFSEGKGAARVEIAAGPAEREKGLMFRGALPADQGMLFAYPDDRPLGFWMKNCATPLSAAFLDRDGLVLNLAEMAAGTGIADDDLPRYRSAGDARYVLEMAPGWFSDHGIRAGDRAELRAALRGVEPR